MMEWHPEFKAGRGRLKVSFTGGHLCGGASTAAGFETADPVVQAVIEGSEAFGSGRIRIVREWEVEGPSPSREARPAHTSRVRQHSEERQHRTVMEFDDLQSAADFLQEKKGIGVDRVLTCEQCVAEASTLDIDLRIK